MKISFTIINHRLSCIFCLYVLFRFIVSFILIIMFKMDVNTQKLYFDHVRELLEDVNILGLATVLRHEVS